MNEDALDQERQRYDRVEQAYIAALASGAEDAALRTLARQVAEAAQAWESADNTTPTSSSGVTRYYDVPEVVSSMWSDLADAYDHRAQ